MEENGAHFRPMINTAETESRESKIRYGRWELCGGTRRLLQYVLINDNVFVAKETRLTQW